MSQHISRRGFLALVQSTGIAGAAYHGAKAAGQSIPVSPDSIQASRPAQPMTILEAALAIRRGDLTSVDLVESALQRATDLDRNLGVFITRFQDQARIEASQADQDLADGLDRGPLQGIPFGLKDNITAKGGPTTAQSRISDPSWSENSDATVVSRLKRAGAIIVGKNSMMEFATGLPDRNQPFPLPLNPWNPDHWSGGSSSGTGGGLAAGMFLGGLGTDTGGSIRVPAAYCGVTGLKPTFGLVPSTGSIPTSHSLDAIGPMARSARDCAAILQVIAGADEDDPASVRYPVPDYLAGLHGSISGMRIGVSRDGDGPLDDPAVRGAFAAALDKFQSAGARLVNVTLPYYREAQAALAAISAGESVAFHRGYLQSHWDDYSPSTRIRLGTNLLFSAADYVDAQRIRRPIQKALASLFSEIDVVAMPTCGSGAPLFDRVVSGDKVPVLGTARTGYWNVVGTPSIAVPMGFDATGLPFSLQLSASAFCECKLFRVADAYQRITDWHLRVPPGVGDMSR